MSNESSSNESSLPITPGQATDIGTEIQRHCSRAIAGLRDDQVRRLQSHPQWLDMWTTAALRLRLYRLRVGVHSRDPNKEFLLGLIKRTAGAMDIPPAALLEDDPMSATVLVLSRSHLIHHNFGGPSCFFVLVEDDPQNPSLLKIPTVFLLQKSGSPAGHIATVLYQLRAMR